MNQLRYWCFRRVYSPFSNERIFKRLVNKGFRPGSLWNAEIIVVRNRRHAKLMARLFPWKRVIIWTNEPSYDYTDKPVLTSCFGHEVNVFNVYTNNVFWHNRHFLGSYHYDDTIDLGMNHDEYIMKTLIPSKSSWMMRRTAAAIYAKKVSAACHGKVSGQLVDLNAYRQGVAESGQKRGVCDLVGKGWSGLEIEDSGFSGNETSVPWWTRKIELLGKYKFNLSFENTNWPYYVTEKIWQSIKAGCLPVYWGQQNSIYESFSSKSFVDASDFSSDEALWDTLISMSYEEWRARMEKCIEAYNRELKVCQDQGFPQFEETIDQICSVL